MSDPDVGEAALGAVTGWCLAGVCRMAVIIDLRCSVVCLGRVRGLRRVRCPGVIVDRFAREDVMEVLDRYGIGAARRAADADGSEEIILVSQSAYEQADIDGLTRALMEVLPHVKVWVVPDNQRWSGEPI